jgi:osmotically-inducible protein OsmY
MKQRRNIYVATVAGLVLALSSGCSSTPRTVGQTIDDATVTARVKAALIEDPQTKAYQIDVDTYQQAVKLNGFVDSEAARVRASAVARGVDGVKSVDNDLTVKP